MQNEEEKRTHKYVWSAQIKMKIASHVGIVLSQFMTAATKLRKYLHWKRKRKIIFFSLIFVFFSRYFAMTFFYSLFINAIAARNVKLSRFGMLHHIIHLIVSTYDLLFCSVFYFPIICVCVHFSFVLPFIKSPLLFRFFSFLFYSILILDSFSHSFFPFFLLCRSILFMFLSII